MNNNQVEPNDILVIDIEKMAGEASILVSYFAYGNGKELYSNIASTLGDESTKRLYSDDVTVQELNKCMETWSQEKENCSTHKM